MAQREADFDLATRNFDRASELLPKHAMSQERLRHCAVEVLQCQGGRQQRQGERRGSGRRHLHGQALIIAAEAAVESSQATIERIQADINDSTLKAPRAGRVQYRVSQPGEVLNAGGKVLNMVDLNDVYMTFFLPTDWAGRVKLGAEVRLVLDAAPQFVIPAKVTFVADVAQFTPKTVETAEERQKLTFRIKAHIPPEVLKKYVRDVKTGLPGMAYVQLDPQAPWPAHLEVKLPP